MPKKDPDPRLQQGDLFTPRATAPPAHVPVAAPVLPAAGPARVLVFDLETQNSFDDVGGRGNIEALRMSIGCTYEPDRDRQQVYTEAQVGDLVEALFAAELVVGFNVKHFDFRVLAGHLKRDYTKIRCLDLLEDLHRRLGFRVKLDAVASATLGQVKSGHGLMAIEWFRKGELDKLISYCQDDVKITWRVYQFGRDHGHVLIPNWNTTRRVAVEW
ncbi:MAG: ribonuclease H-like domain-containing protein [Planctomycetes bacterium]|nr:ribonuclease H-like domain-containing protein [Planctomycetota bacterium]